MNNGAISAREKEEIAAFVLGVKRHELHLGNISIKEEDAARIDGLVRIRSSGYPLQYLLGEVQFIDSIIKVHEGVLIPRPETEILVETVSNRIRGSALFGLDLGTGTGCIAIGLTKLIKDCKIIASDISSISVDIASRNAALNDVSGRVEFVLSDMFDFMNSFSEKKACPERSRRADFIVSNPPYIKTSELKHLPVELSYEPREALDGGADGLLYIRRIIEAAPRVLKPSGLLAIEMGDGQREDIERFARKSRNFSTIEFVKDLNGIDRVFLANVSS